MSLVINLYKEQDTIKGFEESVRTLKNDISNQLKLSPDKKDQVMKDLRTEIQKAAAKRLKGNFHILRFSFSSKVMEL